MDLCSDSCNEDEEPAKSAVIWISDNSPAEEEEESVSAKESQDSDFFEPQMPIKHARDAGWEVKQEGGGGGAGSKRQRAVEGVSGGERGVATAEAYEPQPAPKRQRGRPPGSTNAIPGSKNAASSRLTAAFVGDYSRPAAVSCADVHASEENVKIEKAHDAVELHAAPSARTPSSTHSPVTIPSARGRFAPILSSPVARIELPKPRVFDLSRSSFEGVLSDERLYVRLFQDRAEGAGCARAAARELRSQVQDQLHVT